MRSSVQFLPVSSVDMTFALRSGEIIYKYIPVNYFCINLLKHWDSIVSYGIYLQYFHLCFLFLKSFYSWKGHGPGWREGWHTLDGENIAGALWLCLKLESTNLSWGYAKVAHRRWLVALIRLLLSC